MLFKNLQGLDAGKALKTLYPLLARKPRMAFNCVSSSSTKRIVSPLPAGLARYVLILFSTFALRLCSESASRYKRSSRDLVCFYLHEAIMIFYDAVNYGETEPRSLAYRLGREKRLETRRWAPSSMPLPLSLTLTDT